MEASRNDVTRLLHRIQDGDNEAKEALVAALYRDLYARARQAMKNQGPGHTLQATALLNEAYVRILGPERAPWADRRHFLQYASSAMRTILIDSARRRESNKHSPGGERIPIETIALEIDGRPCSILALDAALERLEIHDAQMAQAVQIRFFGGQSMQDTADAIGMPKSTLEKKWAATRAWLAAEVQREASST